MAQILVQVPETMIRELENVAPGSSRKRSRFIRLAIQKALMDLQDVHTRDAYRRLPDDEPAYFDPNEWAEWVQPRRKRGRRGAGSR